MADFDNRLDREDGIRTMDALEKIGEKYLPFFEGEPKMTELEYAIWFTDRASRAADMKKAAAELASLRERAEKAEAERDAVKELAKRARVQLQATQINWQEECLYECNDLLTLAIGACPSCTWRGDVTLQDGKCPYCKTDWLKLEDA